MRRHLWVLDLTLLVAVTLCGFALKQRWTESSQREQTLLKQIVPVATVPALPGIPGVQPATPASYMSVAQMNLFAKDRNPNVILDPPPPPPPPPQMPALPVAYGIIDLGTGPTAILAEKAGSAHRGYRPGESIGAFKIVAMNNREILFDWDGQHIKKTLEELAAAKSNIVMTTQNDGSATATNTAAPAPAPAAAPSTTTIVGGVKGPGTDLGNETRACAPGDTSPPGAVEGGLRKVVTKSPFGEVCRWEPVR